MKISEITRVKLGTLIEIPTDELSQSTLKEAEELLGYIPQDEKSETPNALFAAIAELGIEILDWRKVLLYEAEAVHQSRLDSISQERSLPTSRDSWHFKSWAQTKLADWKQPIPLHVIEKANQIKRRCPDVQFFVESLSETPDPFLVDSIPSGKYEWDKCEYFIEVWEEPKFER